MAKVATKIANIETNKNKNNTARILKCASEQHKREESLELLERTLVDTIEERTQQLLQHITFRQLGSAFLKEWNLSLIEILPRRETILILNDRSGDELLPYSLLQNLPLTRKIQSNLHSSKEELSNVAAVAIIDSRINDEISTNMFDPPIYAYVSTTTTTIIASASASASASSSSSNSSTTTVTTISAISNSTPE